MSWPLAKFKDVAQIVTGSTPKKVDGNYNGTVPFVTPGDLGSNALISNAKVTVTEKGAKSGRLLPKGSVMVCCIGATIGKVGIAERDVISNQQINSLIFDELQVYPKYGYYFCLTIKPLLLNRSSSTTMPIVNKSNFSEFEIPLPPLDEQKRIAAILDKADAIRRKRQQAIQLADDFLRSVFLDMFGDPTVNPKGWEVKNIAELALSDKYSLKRGPFGGALKKEVFVDSGYLVYEQYHALNNDFTFARYFIDEEKYQELKAFDVVEGDIIISCSGVNLGRLAIVPKGSPKGIINQALLKVKLDESKMLNEMFLSIFTHPNFKREFFGDNRGSGVPNFPPMSTFKEFDFIVPPLEMQQQYISLVHKVEQLKIKVKNSYELSDTEFNSLSQKAFAGEL